ncbi:bifunctional demethylmenaquinone methyltransferase/2-methoxy-6-polyprenyl-1,4-benzoquinol methylase UbiE [Proteiniphilum sp. UBA1028]|jgi:demethylmenaquinone methyltransferase/2-methoxy-6-polyprenyl-1,4-benzoquinol methylase|uniref:bifunctional demethylmenaquinone methyltransferase/2-methoxy-6-polyprenyl-1,4-benzoquinol methylase UbiE n=1 Tax=Proteiniphilum sp. UBA1028 TaxID=1947251 RepID=UPI000E9A48F6|nr:bifunctional demethylmenaquinone methyltransferase/2-methoxy-6-polyprenyl-1,4-benzoquinol methylase UbiE [Proteiniphilum sp. UBA1028]HBG56413.1 bifunctional demethylmenaquinone methyltransferase/2-methoxy-6-polyprenyl-1,4-benzoquinol methylase UbiE [Porphyromonadaceae bacterium]
MSYKVEKVNPYDSDRPKNEQVIRMFNEIAPNYDRLNGTLSLGIDNYWRRDALKELRKYHPRHILDIATGTGDFAILAQQILRPDKISAVDISDGMMEIGKEKVKKRGLEKIISFENQDCSTMTFPDNSYDAATVAFGVRNFENIDQSFQEVLRVLKPGGVFLFIELTTPGKTPIKELYATYTKYVMPFLSGLFATEQRAYRYLPASIAAFPQGREMMLILRKNGFTNIRLRRYTMGISTLYIAEKPVK